MNNLTPEEREIGRDNYYSAVTSHDKNESSRLPCNFGGRRRCRCWNRRNVLRLRENRTGPCEFV